MSYSFTARGATAADALAAAAAKFDEVVAQQPIHAQDKEAALAALQGMAGVLPVDVTKDVALSLNGWVSWQGDVESQTATLSSASVTASVSLVDKETVA
jgi:hypothetical protein